ncbi:ATP-binding protein [Haladaptatus sp. DJG-WS-42]|uniref:ATP-binding protein n=1 Tax=Haladaptatus sp. DJG-WS-42 TaxID=3120516 RepID=UPI0030CF7248
MSMNVNASGFIIAAIGFFLTRFTVTLALYESPVQFYLSGVLPLTLGLGLAAFGVALAVADIEPSLVRTTARWCVIGAGTMLILVSLTLLGTAVDGIPTVTMIRSQAYLSNFLIGGSVGGTLTGLYAARTRRQRGELQQHTNRLVILNRLLRHEILNSVTVIRGYASLSRDEHAGTGKVIEKRLTAIEQTIDQVKYLTRRAGQNDGSRKLIKIEDTIQQSVEEVSSRHSGAAISIESIPETAKVVADEQLAQVFTHLLENALIHGRDETPTVEVTVTRTSVRVSVKDNGPGLPESQQALLETPDIEEFDDPTAGFGLKIVRLLVENYRGTLETESGASGTTVTVVLPRANAETIGLQPTRTDVDTVRPTIQHMLVTLGASVVAGVFFGIAAMALGRSVAGIGVFYGAVNPVIGWLTHEFHSIVFGFIFVNLVSMAPERYRTSVLAYVAIGAVWGLVLWVGASGIIAPIWLQLLGIPAPIPNLTFWSFVTHLVWGISLGALTAWGYKYLAARDDTSR